MKTVFTNAQCAHVWAQNTQDHGRGSKGTIFFSDGVIYSYGTHFPIARHFGGVVLFTSQGYSISTSKHKSYVLRACSHLRVYEVNNVLANSIFEHKDNAAEMVRRIEIEISKGDRSRVYKRMYFTRAQSMVQECKSYCAAVGIEPPALPELSTAQLTAQDIPRELRRVNKLTYEEQRAAWRKGKRQNAPGPIMLRLAGDNVRTSHGAEFSLNDAKAALYFIRRTVKSGEDFICDVTIPLGSFRIDAISKDGDVRAGCHIVSNTEIETLAKEIGL